MPSASPSPSVVAVPRSAPTALRATLAFGRDQVAAAFTGMRALPAAPSAVTPFHRTHAPDRPPAQAVAPVCLGAGPDGFLFVDLALAPGVITVSGDRRVREEVGAELVNRLGAAVRDGARRVAVVVAGTPFPAELAVVEPIRVADAGRFDPAWLGPDVEVCFLACPLQDPGDAAMISTLMRWSGLRIIPIVVDDVVAADWSLHAWPTPGVGAHQAG